MKTLSKFLAISLIIFAVACEDNMSSEFPIQQDNAIKVTAYSDGAAQTKTGIIDKTDGGKSVVWKSGDAISLFVNSGNNGGTQLTTTNNGPVAEFTGSGTIPGGSNNYWGLYPYNANASCNGSSITTLLPASQSAYQGDVADNLLVTVGKSENLSIYFKNTCAIIGFTMSQENISKVTFSGRNDEYVAGEFTASFDGSNNLVIIPTNNAVKSIEITPAESSTFATGTTYYFAILPQSFESGYTLTFTRNDNETATYERTSAFNFSISTFYTMTNKDSGLPFSLSGNILFEDDNFKAYCVKYFDTNSDGEISYAEGLQIEIISCGKKSISSLKGIEFFTNLKQLECLHNQISVIDASNNPALQKLICSYNQLTTLDVSNNHVLEEIDCLRNQLTSLDVSNNSALQKLICGYNQLTTLDISNNHVLEKLSCEYNQLISLDVSNNTALTSLNCHSNKLKSLDLGNNLCLVELNCGHNELTELDASLNTELTRLSCGYNELTELDVSLNTELTSLSCGYNQLTGLNVSKNLALQLLECSNNQLTSLDVNNNLDLQSLNCSNMAIDGPMGNNQLPDLDVSHNTKLLTLNCYRTNITKLNLSNNTALINLDCSYNYSLTELDVSNNLSLQFLKCRGDLLTRLDVSNNLDLQSLDCSLNNHLKEIWLKTNQSIPTFVYDTDIATIYYKD